MKLKEFRKEACLSQYALSDLSRVARHKLQVAEGGIAILTRDEARRISKILGFGTAIPDWLKSLIEKEEFENEN